MAWKVAVIGLGGVTQTIHWPVLRDLGELFEITHVCDLSLKLQSWAQSIIPNVQAYSRYEDMLSKGGFDVVLVANSDEYHADCAVSALQAGFSVLIEKPVALTLEDVYRIVEAKDRSKKTCMVGYMRRVAPGFEKMREEIAAMPEVEHVSVRDYIGPNRYFVNQVHSELRPDDLPEAAIVDRNTRRLAMTKQAVGSVDVELQAAYRLLCGLSSHDLSALRDLVGSPHSVIGAAVRGRGRRISAIFDHGSFVTNFETGLDSVGEFDAYIEVFGGNRRARIDYDSPYIRHLPTLVTSTLSDGDAYQKALYRETFTDPYTRQWKLFDSVIRGVRTNPMPPEDSIPDLTLFAQIIAAARRTQ